MAGFVKIWTDILDDEWIKTCNNVQFSFFVKLLVLCKNSSTLPVICCKNRRELASKLDADERTVTNFCDKCVRDGKLIIEDGQWGGLRITIVNYEKWQRLKRYSEARYTSTKSLQKSPINAKKNALQIRLEEKRREENNILSNKNNLSDVEVKKPQGGLPEIGGTVRNFFDLWAEEYAARWPHERDGQVTKYAFVKGKDGKLAKEILTVCPDIEKVRELVRAFLRLEDSFIKDKSGYTIGMFKQKLNMLMQKYNGTQIVPQLGEFPCDTE